MLLLRCVVIRRLISVTSLYMSIFFGGEVSVCDREGLPYRYCLRHGPANVWLPRLVWLKVSSNYRYNTVASNYLVYLGKYVGSGMRRRLGSIGQVGPYAWSSAHTR